MRPARRDQHGGTSTMRPAQRDQHDGFRKRRWRMAEDWPADGGALPGERAAQEVPAAGRGLRADARRNRARVLAVAAEVFAAEGLSVPVHEIARRAGVGTGTVSRHFPTKEALYEAVFVSRVEWLVGRARLLKNAADAGGAFFDFFGAIVTEGAANRGLADALTGAGFDIKAAASGPGHDVM